MLFIRWFVVLVLMPSRGWAGSLFFVETTPFVSGQGGYHTYRIPAIVRSTNGTLLAFCEGRKNSASDSGDIDIVLRRSTNNGATWLPQTVVQEEGGGATITIGNPAPVVDETTGKIHLLFCRNNDRVFQTFSADDGIAWSARTEITANVKLSNWGWYATGPCHGIQLQRGAEAGRLVVPCDFRTTDNLNGAHAIYSDDHGSNWQLGAVNAASDGINPNETTCVELVSLSLGGNSRTYFNSRDQNGAAAGTRGEAWSSDGGSSFTAAFTNRTAFVCPVVEGSLLRVHATDQGSLSNRILFSCPNHNSSRVSMSVWSSASEGTSWGEPKLIYSGPSAYSDMALTASGEVALLYEKGAGSPYETITFARFNEAWLDAAPAPAENPGPAFWNFEEQSPGGTASTNAGGIRDVHPAEQGNDLTSQKAFAYVNGGTDFGSGAALAFDGGGGLQMPDSATENHFDFAGNDSFTIEAVFRIPNGSTQTGALVAKDYGTLLPSWWLRVENGKLRFLVSDGSGENAVTLSQILVNDGQWHHVAAVRDTRISGTKLLRLYLDGVLRTNLVDATTNSLANAQPLNIGRFGASSTRNLTGDIDLVRATPVALTPERFVGHYTQFDADADAIPDLFERANYGSLGVLGTADVDSDGALDVLEFAQGSDALSQNSRPTMSVALKSNAVESLSLQRALPPWLELQLQWSTNLLLWQSAPGTAELLPFGGELLERRQTIGFAAGLPPASFFRLRLLQLP